MAWMQARNWSQTALAAVMASDALSCTVVDAALLPDDDCWLVIWDATLGGPEDDENREIVLVTEVAGNVLTVTRGQQDTVGVAHAAGAAVANIITAGDKEELAAAIDGKAASGHNHSGVYEPADAGIQSHLSSTTNPHAVTAAQVGLGTSDTPQFARLGIGTAAHATFSLNIASHVGIATNKVVRTGGANTTDILYLDCSNVILRRGDGSVAYDAVTARLHIAAGVTTAGGAPLKLTSGTSLTTAEAGAIEFTTDDLFFTITTGPARKRLLMADATAGLTSGRVPYATTNGRLADASTLTYDGSYLQSNGYKSSDGTAGATADVAVAKVGGGTRTLSFKNGLYTGYADS